MKRSGNQGKTQVKTSARERRVATQSPELVAIRLEKAIGKAPVSAREQTSGLLTRLAKALNKPGVSRASVFSSSLHKPVFAYSVDPKDPSKIVREDASGHKTVGRVVRGRFQSLGPARAD